jgi:SAM-dependent methyltransferase
VATGSDDLVSFYDRSYSRDPATSERGARWRALSAVGKADHVITLSRRAGLDPQKVVEIGCGNGALLSELHRRGFASHLSGFEIAEAAAGLARGAPGVESVATFDGVHLPVPDVDYDLGILSHVLEHVPDPAALLAEAARACRAVFVEVPLEQNLSARRASKRAGAAEVGHLQRLDRAAVRGIARRAGLHVVAELDDPLPRSVQRFFAASVGQRARADAKWAMRAGLAAASPALARRVFTVHHACLCLPAAVSRRAGA